MFADECTSKQMRISFARVLIEINVTQAVPEEITIVDPSGRKFLQTIQFDWKPDFCQKCLRVGHDCAKEVNQESQGEADQQARRRRPRRRRVWVQRQNAAGVPDESDTGQHLNSTTTDAQVQPQQDRITRNPIGLCRMQKRVFIYQLVPSASVAAITRDDSFQI